MAKTEKKRKVRKSKWWVIAGTVRKVLCVVCTFYYLVTISFRNAFRFPTEFKREHFIALLIDYLVDMFFWGNIVYRYFDKVSSHDQVSPSGNDNEQHGIARSISGLEMSLRRKSMAIFMKGRNSIAKKQQVVPAPSSTDTDETNTKSTRGAKLLKSLSSFYDFDIFSQSNETDGELTESDLLSNFRKNQEDHEMLIAIKANSVTDHSHYVHDIFEFIMICPFEIFGYLVGYQYYYFLRTFRVLRVVHIPSYFRGITRLLVDTELMVGASARRVLYLTMFMIMFAHVGGCLFYSLGLFLLEHGETDVWLTYDGIVSFDTDSTDGVYHFNEPLGYRYVRVLYWAVVTSQTVGFGDVRPRAIQETSFCLLFFYLSHFLCAQLAIGNLLLLFDVYDSARTQYKERIEQLEKYAQFRKLPADLKDRITYFYFHQWKVLKGLDESQLLTELPNNIIIKVQQATVRNYLLKVPFLKHLKMVVMNALAENVKLIIFSPSDVIVPMDSISTGMFIISRGEAFISANSNNKNKNKVISVDVNNKRDDDDDDDDEKDDKDDEVRNIEEVVKDDVPDSPEKEKEENQPFMTQSLKCGDYFGVQGLSKKYEQHLSLIAGTAVCEVLFLSRVRFQRTISLLLTAEDAKPYQKHDNKFRKSSTTTDAEDEKARRLSGYQKTLSHVRASAVLNIETSSTTTSDFVLRLKTDGDIRTVWDLFIFFGIAFYSIAIPYSLSHSFNPHLFARHWGLFSLGFLVDIYLFIDFVARMFVFPTYNKSVLMISSKQIFVVFREENSLLLELLSVIPFDFIAILDPNLIPVLRLFKIYHLTKFKDYGANAERAMSKYFNFSLSFSTSRFIRLQIGLFELCHWAACCWNLVADFSTHELNYDINWKIQDRDADFLSIKYSGSMDRFTSYIRSLYWAINALSTSGVADMPSTNVAEMLFVCFALLVGCQSINAVLGSIASMMGNINKSKSDFANKMDTVSNYMKFKRLPVRLQLKIRFFFEYNFERTSGVDEMKLLAGLPQPLREDVVSFVVGSVLIGIPFFHHCSEPMLEMILGLLTRRCFLNDDDVVLEGEFGKEFFIIESGMILVTSKDKSIVYANLKNGNYIGESCLLKVVERTASAHARDYSETYVLKKSDFENVVEDFPEDGEIVKDKINSLLRSRTIQNKKLQVKKSRRSMIATFVRMESIHTLDTSNLSVWASFLEQFSYLRKLWQCFLLFILIYNIFMISVRLAFTKDSFVLYYVIDYSFDVILWIDMYLNAQKFKRIVGGKIIKFPHLIWKNYKATEFKHDALARFPYDLLALVFISDATPLSPWFVLAFLRLPKMFLLIRGSDFLSAAEYVIEKARISFFALRMLQVLASCLLVGHCLGCGLYVFQKAHYGEQCVNEENAFYGDACQYRDTWIQFLIYTSKLPQDGGSAFARYVACINWAIPTMVLYTVGDVYPMNNNETAFIFGAMFIGIPINAMIVGTIIALVTQVDDQSADILMKSDTLRENLIENFADADLIERVSDYINFLVSDDGKLLGKEEEIFEELPHTLQVMLSSHLKEHFFHNCPFFDHFPEQAIRNLCMTMQQRIYYTGDHITTQGDIGHEMFFIESGDCEVISWDKRTILAKLTAGAFLCETSFFGLSDHGNKYMNLENIRASSICVCYVLKKKLFVHEMSPYAEGENADKRAENLLSLSNSHCKRNVAILHNLKSMETANSKLSKILGPVTVKITTNPWIEFIAPTGKFLLIVDVIGYICLVYYAFVVPFEIAFMHKADISVYSIALESDFVIDIFCAIELFLRLVVFPYAKEELKSYDLRATELYKTRADVVIDMCASIPFEVMIFLPFIPSEYIFFFRLFHLLRLRKLSARTKRLEEQMIRVGITLHFTTLAVVRGILVYFLGNHWMACLYFSIHRYFERKVRNTWVVVDGYATFDEETQQHDICNRAISVCYQRAIYFVGTVLTSVGYGDVAPITTGEMIFQVFLAIVGACMGANICGQLSNYLKLGDRTGEMAFKEKLKSVEHYCSYRNLNPDLRLSIIANYHIMWNKERRVGTKKSSFMHALSTGMTGDVALALNKQIMDVIPLFQVCRTSLHARLAYALKPQITLPDTSIYTVGDSGSSFFLILTGQVNVTTTRKDSKLDPLTLASLSILENKHAYLKNTHETGHHFGEFALTSKLGIRRDRAVATQLTETYALDKEELWNTIFQRMPTPEQYLFLKSLFTTVGGFMYIDSSKIVSTEVKILTNREVPSLSHLVKVVIEDITGTGSGSDSVTHMNRMSPLGENSMGCFNDDGGDGDVSVTRQALMTKSILALESFSDTTEDTY